MSFLKIIVTIGLTFAFCVFAEPKIVVVGGGLAGLTAAHRLNADLYEARSRVGGRVFTVRVGNALEELGGKNINDGGDGVNIAKLSKELGLEVDAHVSQTDYYFYDATTDKVYDFYRELMPSFPLYSDSMTEELAQLQTQSKTLSDVLDVFLQQHPVLRRVYETRLRGYEGAPTNQLSPVYAQGSFSSMLARAAHGYERTMQGHSPEYATKSIRGGNSRLAQALASNLKGKLHLNMALTSMKKGADNNIELRFSNGEIVLANIVVLAIPAPIMKDIEFDQDLIPKDRMQQIASVAYGSVTKVLFPLPDNHGHSGFGMSDNGGFWFSDEKKVMTIYYTGPFAKYESYLASDVKAVNAIFPNLKLPAEPRMLPVKDELFSQRDGPVALNWESEPYSKGGCSNFSPEQMGEQVVKLFEPIRDKIFFAGEHTAIENPATMEGAVESGERVARVILEIVK